MSNQLSAANQKVAVITGASQGIGAALVAGLPQARLGRRRQLPLDRAFR